MQMRIKKETYRRYENIVFYRNFNANELFCTLVAEAVPATVVVSVIVVQNISVDYKNNNNKKPIKCQKERRNNIVREMQKRTHNEMHLIDRDDYSGESVSIPCHQTGFHNRMMVCVRETEKDLKPPP